MADASRFVTARISLSGQSVGAVSEDRSGRITFEYDDEFRKSSLELSPIHLPLSRRGPQEFPVLARSAAFDGLPGLLADALPDAFGNAVIRAYFERQGTPDSAFSPVQKLLYIGSRAVGALEFTPALDRSLNRAEADALSVAKLVTEARRVIEGDTTVAIPEIMQVGASAGGARAKALILWNRSKDLVKSAFAPMKSGDEHWLIKFDGVTDGRGGPAVQKITTPGPFGRIEFAYAQMAAAAGIDMEETFLLRDRKFAHFMTKRFDRAGARRIHMHTLGGIQHVDYNLRGIYSYEEYFRTVRALGMHQDAVDQAYRRMVFNIMGANQDDHVKNLGFLMDMDGTWRISPAYDVTFAKGNTWTRTHQMTLAGKDEGFTRADLLRAGASFDVPRDGSFIIDEVEAALGLWDVEAKEAGVPTEWITHVRDSFLTRI